MQRLIIIAFLLLCTGCTSVASSTLAFVVAKQSEKDAIKNRVYKGINRCFVRGKPEAFFLAQSVYYGSPIVVNPEIMLNPEGLIKEPIESYNVAYAYYVIAERIGDGRAKIGQDNIRQYIGDEEAGKIEAYIDKKYLKSYLNKCFYVPPMYKVYVKPRDMV